MKNKLMGRVITSNSANDMGKMFVIVANVPLKIVEIYLLKKSANGVYQIAVIYKIRQNANIAYKT